MSEVTRILESLEPGDPEPAGELLPLVYEELRKLAKARMAGERVGHTLQATALVHEAWIKLSGTEGEGIEWNDRRHFYAAAAEAMRRILIDHARHKMAAKRGGDWLRITFGDHEAPSSATPPEMLDLNDALEKLSAIDAEKAEGGQAATLRWADGCETGAALGVSKATIKRRWSFVKAWLGRELKRDDPETVIA